VKIFDCSAFLAIHRCRPVAEFIDPDLEDKVNSGIELSYRPARQYGLAGRYDIPYAGVNFIPPSGIYEFGYVVPGRYLVHGLIFLKDSHSTVTELAVHFLPFLSICRIYYI
jgi:hypothetical protein